MDLKFKSLKISNPSRWLAGKAERALDLRTRLNDLKGTLQTNEKLDGAARCREQDRQTRQAKGRSRPEGEPMPETQKTAGSSAVVEQAAESSLLDQIVEQGRFADPLLARGKNLVKEFVAQVLEGSMTLGRDADQMISARVAQIDHLVSIQLNEILHNQQFQVEGTWRGLKFRRSIRDRHSAEDSCPQRIEKDPLRDLQRAPESDQSAMFKKVYEEEYGLFGGEPFALVGDYEFSKHPEDLNLEKVSQVAAAAHAPALVGGIVRTAQHGKLHKPRPAARHRQDLRQHRVREVEGLPRKRRPGHVALTRPRVLMRLPYGRDTAPVEAIHFEEGVDGN